MNVRAFFCGLFVVALLLVPTHVSAEIERVLVLKIRERTGVAPTLDTLDGGEHALLFRLRNRDGMAVSRYVVLPGQYDAVVIALRAVARIVKLDHVGPPLAEGER